MKHLVCCILFLFSVVWGWNTIGKCYTPVEKRIESAKAVSGEATQNFSQTITVLVAANSYADFSAQPTTPVTSNIVRRYRPAGFSFDKLLTYITEGRELALSNAFKIVIVAAQEYAARQKNAGYYIYTLRKIII